MNAQTYLDFATPALAAGAIRRNAEWTLPGEKTRYGFVQGLCHDHGIEPVKMDPPKARTLAQLKRANLAALHAGNDPKGRDGLAMRAMQYALAMQGVETKYREYAYTAAAYCKFGKASDGSTRVRSVKGFDIPNWDFVAALLPVEQEGVFA